MTSSGIPIRSILEAEARHQLTGVGDPAAGEWASWSGYAAHLRRRLTAREARTIGPVLDIRRTPEAAIRAARLGDRLRLAPASVLAQEVGDQHQ